MSAMDVKQLVEKADETVVDQQLGEQVPKKPKSEKQEKGYFSYDDEMVELMKTTSEKLTFIEARQMMQKALPHEIMRMVMQTWMAFDPQLDPTYVVRQLGDKRLAVHMRYIETGTRPEIAHKVWQVIHTEALRRVLLSSWSLKDEKMRQVHLRWFFHVVSALDASEKDHNLEPTERLINEEMLRLIHMKADELEDHEDANWTALREDAVMAAEWSSIKTVRGFEKTMRRYMSSTTFAEPAYMSHWK